jgi:hypothetical protein
MVVAGERREDVGEVSGSLVTVMYQGVLPMAVWRRRVILFFGETAWDARRGEKRYGLLAYLDCSVGCLVCSVKSDIGHVVTTALTNTNTE